MMRKKKERKKERRRRRRENEEDEEEEERRRRKKKKKKKKKKEKLRTIHTSCTLFVFFHFFFLSSSSSSSSSSFLFLWLQRARRRVRAVQRPTVPWRWTRPMMLVFLPSPAMGTWPVPTPLRQWRWTRPRPRPLRKSRQTSAGRRTCSHRCPFRSTRTYGRRHQCLCPRPWPSIRTTTTAATTKMDLWDDRKKKRNDGVRGFPDLVYT